MASRFSIIVAIVALWACPEGIRAAQESVYGLESVKLDRVFDPDARPQRLLLVSGSLKLVGGLRRGNVWQAVTHIPQRTAAPRSDHGVYRVVGDRILFYSFLTFGTYQGQVLENGERILVTKISKDGKSQAETWYIVR